MIIFDVTRTSKSHQAGHMRPAGRVFETPGLESVHECKVQEIKPEETKKLSPSNNIAFIVKIHYV